MSIALELVPLCAVDAELAERIVLPGTPSGTRAILEVLSLQLIGTRLKAKLKGRAAADWLTMSLDGKIGTLDVRATLETDDGALVFMQYNGRLRYGGADQPRQVFVAPRFDTGDPRYAWLNAVQAVGKGLIQPGSQHLHYEFFELV